MRNLKILLCILVLAFTLGCSKKHKSDQPAHDGGSAAVSAEKTDCEAKADACTHCEKCADKGQHHKCKCHKACKKHGHKHGKACEKTAGGKDAHAEPHTGH